MVNHKQLSVTLSLFNRTTIRRFIITNASTESGISCQEEADLSHLLDGAHPAVELSVASGLDHPGRVVAVVGAALPQRGPDVSGREGVHPNVVLGFVNGKGLGSVQALLMVGS